MPLLEAGHPVEDAWTLVADEQPIPADAPAIIPLNRLGEVPPGRNAPIGLLLPSSTPVSDLGPIAARAALIAVQFPVFRDGRGFTLARTLRERYGFAGEIRAVGHILPDQYEFLVRCGVTKVEVPAGVDLRPWQEALQRFHIAYQPAVGDPTPTGPLLKRRLG